jgi:hypothetical protein
MKYQIEQPKKIIPTLPNARPVPIILRFRNRFLFLYLTVRSLEATGCPPDLLIDDCSTDAATLQYVYTNREYKTLVPAWWPSDSTWTRCVGEMPTYYTITGIRNKYKVDRVTQHMGGTNGMYYCVRKSFETFDGAEAIILIESDVVFCENWYQKLIERWKDCSGNVGIVSGFNADGYGFTAQLYLITRQFYDVAKDDSDFTNEWWVSENMGDLRLLATCRKYAFIDILSPPSSLCQHIGYKSETYGLRGRDNDYVLSSNLDGRLVL